MESSDNLLIAHWTMQILMYVNVLDLTKDVSCHVLAAFHDPQEKKNIVHVYLHEHKSRCQKTPIFHTKCI